MSTSTSRPASVFPTILCIGDGQLARMLHSDAVELGLCFRILASRQEESAAQVVGDVVLGDYTSKADVLRAAEGSTVITFEHEHVPADVMSELLAHGMNVQPSPDALAHAQDKLHMRQVLSDAGIAVPPFVAIDSVDDARAFFAAMDGAVCVKARRGGYDGKGVWFPAGEEELVELVEQQLAAGTLLMAEKKVTLLRELSALLARSPRGEMRFWDIAETNQEGGVCRWALAPAAGVDVEHIQSLAGAIAEVTGVTGVLAVELFDTPEGIFVNELAMRPHNTGHWTQDGSVTSQFEQHLRAVANWPLGDTSRTADCVVMANVLGAGEPWDAELAARMETVWRTFPAAKIHLYGKAHRAGRKLGHVTLAGSDPVAVRADALAAAQYLAHGQWPTAAAASSTS